MKLTLNQKKAHDIERHIALTAGAGSGKTAVLVNRYLEILIKKKLRVGQVVAITFTEKAAAELRQRILCEIENRISDGRDVEKLIEIKGNMVSAQISTIHAFCSKILREHPIEAEVDIGFRIIDGIEQRISVRSAVKSVLETIAECPKDDPSRQRLAALLRIFGEKRLEQIIIKLFSRGYTIDRLSDEIYRLSDDQILSYWQKFVQDQLSQVIEKSFPIENWIDHLKTILIIAKGRDAKAVRDLVDKLDVNRNLQKNILILNQISDLVLTKDKKNIAKQNFFGRGTEIEGFENQVQFLVTAGQTVKMFPLINHDDRLLVGISRSLVEIYCRVRDHYDTRNAQQGVLDFDGILVKTKTLLQNQVIRNRLAQRYAYIMVDEYQDTNTLQYEILKPIISNFSTGNFFIVGDQKQSIYGFRDADVRVFQQTTNEILKYQEKNTSDFKWDERLLPSTQREKCGNLHLAENFRLLSNLIAFVNLLFERIMGYELENEFEVRYDPLIKGRSNNASGNVELLLGSEAQSEHQLIAARIHHMIDTKAIVWERNNVGEIERPIRYGDIAVLIRNRTHLPQIESQFVRAEIPYRIAGGIGFYQRQEIYDIINYLQFLESPSNDVALFGLLRAPFFSLSDTKLYEITRTESDLCLWEKLKNYGRLNVGQAEVQSAIEKLIRHLAVCSNLPISILIRKIVSETGMISVLSAGQQGNQRWANYEKLLDIAREFDKSSFMRLSNFLEQLETMILEEDREEQATIEHTNDCVQIMTVHASKGLEFPVVILPGLHYPPRADSEPLIDTEIGIGMSPKNPSKHFDKSAPAMTEVIKTRLTNRQLAEEKRLFYVAATRARDCLILSATLDEGKRPKGWLAWTLDALGLGDEIHRNLYEFPVTIKVVNSASEGSYDQVNFTLPLSVIRSVSELGCCTRFPRAQIVEPTIDLPKIHIEPLQSPNLGGTFSVSELVTYAYCPMMFCFKRQFGMSTYGRDSKIWWLNHDVDELVDVAVREVLSQIENCADCDQIHSLVESVTRGSTGLVDVVHSHVDCFIQSEIGDMILSVESSYCEYQVHALVGKHIVHGEIDRVFKAPDGNWEIIEYKTEDVGISSILARIDFYQTQVELQALLAHRLFADQEFVPTTIFFTQTGYSHRFRFNLLDIEEIEARWTERIADIQNSEFKPGQKDCLMCIGSTDLKCFNQFRL